MKRNSKKRKRGSRTQAGRANPQTNAQPKVYKKIKFRSELEVYMYKLLESSEIPFAYEAQKFVIIEGFHSPNISFERFLNGKGEYKDRGDKKYGDMKYTPDFTPPPDKLLDWVIEVKGRTMPDFSRTWKLFKKLLLERELKTVLYMPRTQKECRETLELIIKQYE